MTIDRVLLGVALLQWIAVVATALFIRKPPVRSLVVSSVILAIAFGVVFAPRPHAKVAAASAVSAVTAGTCASIEQEMSADDVRAKIGNPDRVVDDQKTRGPGAATWVYGNSRCAVHILDGKVALVE